MSCQNSRTKQRNHNQIIKQENEKLHMDTCPYCSKNKVVLNSDELYVCIECASVLSPRYVWPFPRKRPSRKEAVMAILYGYV